MKPSPLAIETTISEFFETMEAAPAVVFNHTKLSFVSSPNPTIYGEDAIEVSGQVFLPSTIENVRVDYCGDRTTFYAQIIDGTTCSFTPLTYLNG